jgi:hypothetical protein
LKELKVQDLTARESEWDKPEEKGVVWDQGVEA